MALKKGGAEMELKITLKGFCERFLLNVGGCKTKKPLDCSRGFGQYRTL